MLDGYSANLIITIGLFTILSLGLGLNIGFTGLLNLGHIAFFGIGAYTSALLSLAGAPFGAAMLAAGFLAAVSAGLLTFAVRKLQGDYLAVATLGFHFVVGSLLLNLQHITRGPLGLPGIPKPEIFGMLVKTPQEYALLVIVCVVVLAGIMYKITSSPYGKLLQAIRDDEVGLSVFGKNIFRLKVESMMIAAFLAGLAGSLFAHYLSYIDPATFDIGKLVIVLTIIIVGGLASFKGTLIATVVIILIPEALRFVEIPSHMLGPMRQLLYAGLLLGILLVRPRGLFGKVDLDA